MTDKEDAAHKRNLEATPENGVKCLIDGVWVHSIAAYLPRAHPGVTVEQYQATYPDAGLKSAALIGAQARAADKAVTYDSAVLVKLPTATKSTKKPFADVFGLGGAPGAKNKRGEPIMIDVLGNPEPEWADYVPDKDENYIHPIDVLKAVMMGCAMNKPVLLWGMHGTGKTSVIEQFCAETNRPIMRVQHTVSTEEAHVLGQYVVKNGSTVFEPGPLAICMRYGLYYLADEYDFALPSVISVYQPVLEGKRLIIKEAPPEWRVVKPHPNFRFGATGNTNGGGDETGLYQGTQMQNAASYSRFGITVEVPYMDEAQETGVVASQGGIHEPDARKLVQFAKHVRDSYYRGDIGVTVSPRELISAAQLGRALGGEWRQGLALAYTNRLNKVDKIAVLEVVQRILGS